MNDRLSYYEFTGILVPGAAVAFAILLCVDQVQLASALADVSVGGLGVLALFAYVLGHLMQALGNLLERGWWLQRGMPTTWVLSGRPPLLTAFQRDRVIDGLIELGIVADRNSLEVLKRDDMEAVAAELYARVAAAGRSRRVDVFNGSYGLHRGLVIAMLAATGVAVGADNVRWAWVFVPLAILAVGRMERYARRYARELYVQFLTTLEREPAPAQTVVVASQMPGDDLRQQPGV